MGIETDATYGNNNRQWRALLAQQELPEAVLLRLGASSQSGEGQIGNIFVWMARFNQVKVYSRRSGITNKLPPLKRFEQLPINGSKSSTPNFLSWADIAVKNQYKTVVGQF